MPPDSVPLVTSVPAATAAAAYLASRPRRSRHPIPSDADPATVQDLPAEQLEELALQGDPLAVAELVRQRRRRKPPKPDRAVRHPPHEPGAHEPGKGELVDEYD